MNRTIYIVMHSNIMHYPPMISLIDILLELGQKIVYIGDYTDTPTVKRFKELGVEFVHIFRERPESKIKIIESLLTYRRRLGKFFDARKLTDNDILWYVFCETAPCIHDVISKYRYLIHYYEFDKQEFSLPMRILFPSFKHEKFAQGAVTTIHCEYNRAQIFRGMNGLNYSPFVLPNKPYIKEGTMSENSIPENIKVIINGVRKKVEGKKVILYQGIFDSRERKLEEFCEAVKNMPDEYMLIAMGRGDSSFEALKNKYESDRFLFIPFIIPPFHLYITQLASIGVLSYSPVNKTINGVINPLYCAPNKIFEYGRFSKPMISNDIPGLRYIFDSFHCGKVVEYPLTSDRIKDTLLYIFEHYSNYTQGALKYYNSIDLHCIVKRIIENI